MLAVRMRSVFVGCVVLCLSASGCGPEAPTESASSGESGTTSGSSTTGATPTTGMTPTTGAPSACQGVALPQGLPPGTDKPYWLWPTTEARQVYFPASASGFACETPIEVPCSDDGQPVLNFIYVVLDEEHQAVGVYPISDNIFDDRPSLYAWLSVRVDGECTFMAVAADDGEVEVLAIDEDCVAIDVRKVSPITVGDSFSVDPNGSANTAFCPM